MPSIGSAGDSYVNAMAESVIGLFKTELIAKNRPWRTADDVELTTLEWVDWYHHRRLHSSIGDIPPAEAEANHYLTQPSSENLEVSEPSIEPEAVQF